MSPEPTENFIDRLYDKLDAVIEHVEQLRIRISSHNLFPNRKVAYGAVTGVVTAIGVKLGFGSDPLWTYVAPVVTGYFVSWLVTDGPAVEHHQDETTIEAEEKALAQKESEDAE